MANFGNRPRLSERPRSKHSPVSFRIDDELLARLDAVAVAQNISRSALIAELVTRMETGPDGRLIGPLMVLPGRPEPMELDMSA